MKREFSSYQDFCRAVADMGLIVASEPTGHEGMHESDPFQPCYAVKRGAEEPWNAFGSYANSEDGTEGGMGVLFRTQEEYSAWIHSDEAMDPMGQPS